LASGSPKKDHETSGPRQRLGPETRHNDVTSVPVAQSRDRPQRFFS
jgi:hypothetical protein